MYGKTQMKLWEKKPFENLNNKNFAKYTDWAQVKSKTLTWKLPHICSSQDHKSQIFISFTLWSDISYFRIFPLTPLLKFQKCHRMFKALLFAKKSNILYATMVSNVLLKFGWDWMKDCRSGILKFPAHWWITPPQNLAWMHATFLRNLSLRMIVNTPTVALLCKHRQSHKLTTCTGLRTGYNLQWIIWCKIHYWLTID